MKATHLTKPIRVLGDSERQLELIFENVLIALHEEHLDQELLNINRFGSLELHNVTLKGSGNKPVIIANDGNLVVLDHVISVPGNPDPYKIHRVDRILK